MTRQKLVIFPKLHDYEGDHTKQWFVYYSCNDPATNKMKRFRLYDGFADLKTKKQKEQHGLKMVEIVKQQLINGWTPFKDRSRVVYSDDLEYKKIAKVNGRLRIGVKTFNYYASEFLKNHNGIRPSTYATYKSKFRYFQEFLKKNKIEDNCITTFGNNEAVEFNKYLKITRGLSPKSINQYNVLMRTFFRELIGQGRLINNPFQGIKKLKTVTKKPRVYNSEYLGVVVNWAEKNDAQLLLVIRLIYNCLIRPGELRKIKIRDVDFQNGQIAVQATIAKTGKHRVVDVPDYLLDQMKKQQLDKYPESCYLIGYSGIPGLKMIGKNNLYNRFVRMRKETKIPREFILYAFKHTGMVELKRSGADWLEIKNQVGHQSLDQVIAYMTELMGESSEHIKKRGPRI